jgi:cystathionine beta-synthase
VAAKHRNGKVRQLILVGPDQTVFHSLRTMQEQDISQLPVFEEGGIVGTIYEDQILNLALQGKDLRKLIIREVMSKPLPQIPRDAPVDRVTHLLSHDSPAVFVVMGSGQFEILTKYDLMGTIAELVR